MPPWSSSVPACDSCSTARVPISRRRISRHPVVFGPIHRVPLCPRPAVASSSPDPRRPRPRRLDCRIRRRLLRVARPLLTLTGVSPLVRSSTTPSRPGRVAPDPTQLELHQAELDQPLLHPAQLDSGSAGGPLCTRTSAQNPGPRARSTPTRLLPW
jgi:hypothetical protein